MMQRGLWAEPSGAYAILVLLALGAVGATMAPGGWRNRPRRARRLVAAAVLVGAALSLLWPQLTRQRALDLDPPTLDAAQLAGRWRDGSDTLVLAPRGTYICHGARCTSVGPRGTWTLASNGSVQVRWSDGHEVSWRLVTYHGRYRLALLPARESGATWSGSLFFERLDY